MLFPSAFAARGGRSRGRRTVLQAWRLLRLEALEDRRLLSASPLWLNPDPGAADGILVQLRDSASDASKPLIAPDVSSLTPGLKRVQLAAGADVAAELAAWRSDPNVLFAEPDYAVSIMAQPDDPGFSDLWGLHNDGQTGGVVDADMDLPEAWNTSVGSGQTIVAVIDTGVDYTHEDLAANIWVNDDEVPGDGLDNDGNGYVDDVHGYDFANNDSDPMDDHNHGTHVAGTIGAVGDNGLGVAGVNWNVQIMALKFLQANGNGNISAAISALEYAVENGAKISNNSWGFGGGESLALTAAVAEAQQTGHIFVAAAGNGNAFGIGVNNDATSFWPSSIGTDNVVAVAALDHNDQLAGFSNYGARTVDVGAPGVDILSTTIGDTYSTFSGTSMATPHVAGAIALIADLHPGWGYEQIIDRLFATVDPVGALDGVTTTGGRVNAASLLAPDAVAPLITSVAPVGAVSSTLDRVQVTFSEAIDGATFTAEDIESFTGPAGDVPVVEVTPVSNTLGRTYDVVFERQTTLGEYTIVVRADIQDYAGNLVDQNQDGAGGRPDDAFVHTFTMLPFVGRYDFGGQATALAAGYTRVTPGSQYSSTAGYGWIGDGGRAVARSGGSALSYDLIYEPSLTFVADAPNGVYDVTLTIGDLGEYAHEMMEVRLEGAAAANVSTDAGEMRTFEFTSVAVGDNQFTLELIDRGGNDPNVVINGLDVVWAGPDDVGPKVIAAEAGGPSEIAVDHVTLTFSEPLAPGSFGVEDVLSVSGPAGPVAVTGVSAVSESVYRVSFAAQEAIGDYWLTIGADIRDTLGNLIDQDGDGVGGEDPDDHYMARFALEPFARAFDFGMPTSPVASGFQQITPSTGYTATTGFGWLNGGGAAVDRVTGGDLARDLVYANELTFVVDAPDGSYDVTLTLGDNGPYAHDDIEVSIEGAPRETLSTPAGQMLNRTYSGVSVSGGQLTLRLLDRGGADANVVINGLELIRTGPDATGPRVIATSPSDTTTGAVDHVTVTFDEPIAPSTFTVSDVASLTGPAGAIAPTSVTRVMDTQYRVEFESQSSAGAYQLVIGPGVADTSGNAMDQDGDGVNGEPADDQFVLDFVLSPFAAQFDFGTATSPLATGHARVAPGAYSAAAGYGYLGGGVQAISRPGGSALTRDLHYAPELTFAIDAPHGLYDIALTLGDTGAYAHDQMTVLLEGEAVDVVTTSAGEVQTVVYQSVAVTDGQLTLSMQDGGGLDENVVLNGLAVTWVGEDTTPPRITAVDPSGETEAPVDRVAVTFSKPIDASSFTGEDVTVLAGPSGPIAVQSVNQLSPTQFEVTFDPQTTVGDYSLAIGPNISDTAGRLLDQDEDGVPGESGDDEFSDGFTITPFALRFDFGTSSSPVATGFAQVTPTTGYTSAQGYGWQEGFLLAQDRASGDAVTRDLVYGTNFTFAADAPDGAYDVTITLGDLGPYGHDEMEVRVEGLRVEVVSTSSQEVTTISLPGVTIADGQFNLQLSDVGGADANAVINGLEIVRSQSAATPRVLRAEAVDSGDGVDRVRLVFNQAMDAESFTPADVVALTRPDGGATAVEGVTAVSPNEFDITFAPQTAAGDYQLILGAAIASSSGELLDQDGDGLGGEDPDDRFVTTFVVPPFSASFDFGLGYSPVEAGYTRVTPNASYSPVEGYGYQGGFVSGVDRFAGSALSRDIHYAQELDFVVDAPDGTYDVTLHVGDGGPYAHDQMAVFLSGAQVDVLTTAPGEVRAVTYSGVVVAGGRLDVRLLDLGGVDANVVLAGLEVETQPVGATSTMRVAAAQSSMSSGFLPPPIASELRPSQRALDATQEVPAAPAARDVAFAIIDSRLKKALSSGYSSSFDAVTEPLGEQDVQASAREAVWERFARGVGARL